MENGAIIFPHRTCNATLRNRCRAAFAKFRLRENDDAPTNHAKCCGKACHASTDNDDIRFYILHEKYLLKFKTIDRAKSDNFADLF
jgi:hypothetical protein